MINAPSIVESGKPFRIQVKAEDAWGNPAVAYRGDVTLHGNDVQVPQTMSFGDADEGVRWMDECVVERGGVHRISVDDGTLVAQSNPIACRNAAPQFALYWGRLTPAVRWLWRRRFPIFSGTREMLRRSTLRGISATITF